MATRTHPVNRRVYISAQEVSAPYYSLIDITRCDEWTHVSVHLGAHTPPVVQEIAARLDPASELGTWIGELTDQAVDLRALRHDTIRYLEDFEPRLLSIPCLPRYIPIPLQAPWVSL